MTNTKFTMPSHYVKHMHIYIYVYKHIYVYYTLSGVQSVPFPFAELPARSAAHPHPLVTLLQLDRPGPRGPHGVPPVPLQPRDQRL